MSDLPIDQQSLSENALRLNMTATVAQVSSMVATILMPRGGSRFNLRPHPSETMEGFYARVASRARQEGALFYVRERS